MLSLSPVLGLGFLLFPGQEIVASRMKNENVLQYMLKDEKVGLMQCLIQRCMTI